MARPSTGGPRGRGGVADDEWEHSALLTLLDVAELCRNLEELGLAARHDVAHNGGGLCAGRVVNRVERERLDLAGGDALQVDGHSKKREG